MSCGRGGRAGAGLLWRLAASWAPSTSSTHGALCTAAPFARPRRCFATTTTTAATTTTSPPAPPARRPRDPPLSFAAASRNPFAGLAKVDLAGARFRLIDARGQVLGLLASHVASLLQGKDRPTFDPSSRAGGDVCVVVNAQDVVLTGRKWEGKVYRRHSGRPGGLKEERAVDVWRRDPARLVERAVAGMLPRSGAARRDRLRKLRVFAGPDHPFASGGGGDGGLVLVPSQPPGRSSPRDKGRGWALPEGFEPMNPLAYARRMRGSKKLAAAAGAAAAGAEGGAVGGAGVAPPPGAGGQPAFDDLLAAGEAEMIKRGGGGGGGGDGSNK